MGGRWGVHCLLKGEDTHQRALGTRWVVGGWLSTGFGQESHPTCQADTLGGRWRRRGGEQGKNPTQRVKMTRWV